MKRKPDRSLVKYRIGLMGYPNSGKSYSAILLAKGLLNGAPFTIIDTEEKADYYPDIADFSILPIASPFTVEKFLKALAHCEKDGDALVIIDSISSEWEGKGGLLEKAGPQAAHHTWGYIKSEHRELMDAMNAYPGDVVCTFRAREKTRRVDVVEGGKRKTEVVSIGEQPIAEKDTQYDFGLFFELERGTHRAKVVRDNTGIFSTQGRALTEQDGARLREWRTGGALAPDVFTDPEVIYFCDRLGIDQAARGEVLRKKIGKLDPTAAETIEKVKHWLADQVTAKEQG